jgi:hypothetical protein
VGNGIGRTVGSVELRKGVQLDRTAEDIAIERQGFTSSSGKMKVGRGGGHASDVAHPPPRHPDIGTTGRRIGPLVVTLGSARSAA